MKSNKSVPKAVMQFPGDPQFDSGWRDFFLKQSAIIKYWGLIKVLTIPLENIKKIRNIEDLEWKNKTTLFSGGAGGISFSFGPASFSKIPVRNGIEIEYKNNKNENRGLLIVSLDKERLKPLKLALENLK
jgi:hypothetical protein